MLAHHPKEQIPRAMSKFKHRTNAARRPFFKGGELTRLFDEADANRPPHHSPGTAPAVAATEARRRASTASRWAM
ncbi:hypothetical protein [Lysobacter gummosus]|uniref:hypothetical protein n=1 Tax=Lysobacter gummosus TaxID=262324 RepID=UPI0036432FB9